MNREEIEEVVRQVIRDELQLVERDCGPGDYSVYVELHLSKTKVCRRMPRDEYLRTLIGSVLVTIPDPPRRDDY